MHDSPENSLTFLDRLTGSEGASIVRKDGVDRALTIVLIKDSEITVGRTLSVQPDCGKRVSLHNPAISRTHCFLGIDRIGVYVRETELGSTNGTWVNSQRLAPGQKQYISENDCVTLGKPEMPFEVAVRILVKETVSAVDVFSGMISPTLRHAY